MANGANDRSRSLRDDNTRTFELWGWVDLKVVVGPASSGSFRFAQNDLECSDVLAEVPLIAMELR